MKKMKKEIFVISKLGEEIEINIPNTSKLELTEKRLQKRGTLKKKRNDWNHAKKYSKIRRVRENIKKSFVFFVSNYIQLVPRRQKQIPSEFLTEHLSIFVERDGTIVAASFTPNYHGAKIITIS